METGREARPCERAAAGEKRGRSHDPLSPILQPPASLAGHRPAPVIPSAPAGKMTYRLVSAEPLPPGQTMARCEGAMRRRTTWGWLALPVTVSAVGFATGLYMSPRPPA